MMILLCGGGDSLNDLEAITEEEVSLDYHSGLRFKGVAESLHIEYQIVFSRKQIVPNWYC